MTAEQGRAHRLWSERRKSGVSQERLGRYLDITREAIGMIEQEKITVDERFEDRWMTALRELAEEVGASRG